MSPSDAATTLLERLPRWARPEDEEPPDPTGLRRAAELAVLLVLGVLLAAATVSDLARQVRLDERIAVDKTTWSAYTHRQLKKINVSTGLRSTRDSACAPPFSGASYRLCLVLTGPTHGRRTITGGYRLPLTGLDRYYRRSDCFGAARRQALCGAPPRSSKSRGKQA
jgi:hypothetical protein